MDRQARRERSGRMRGAVCAVLVTVGALAGCTGGGDPAAGPVTGVSASEPPSATSSTATTRPASGPPTPPPDCAVTAPVPFDPPEGVDPMELFGSDTAAGNGELWVGALGEHGVIVSEAAEDGSIGTKLGWWRHVDGKLTITGRRLDADAPPLRANVPDGYGPRGFQSSGVRFASEGCWEVTGTVGSTSLTFITYVTKP